MRKKLYLFTIGGYVFADNLDFLHRKGDPLGLALLPLNLHADWSLDIFADLFDDSLHDRDRCPDTLLIPDPIANWLPDVVAFVSPDIVADGFPDWLGHPTLDGPTLGSRVAVGLFAPGALTLVERPFATLRLDAVAGSFPGHLLCPNVLAGLLGNL